MNRVEIEKLIPHRAPFLLLDEIVEVTPERLTARFTVEPTLPLFAQIYAGHYPENPLTPGVILCEIIFQAGAVLMATRLQNMQKNLTSPPENQAEKIGGTPVITRVRDVRFKRLVRPQETLDIVVEFTEQLANAYYLNGKISVDGVLAVKTEFTCALI